MKQLRMFTLAAALGLGLSAAGCVGADAEAMDADAEATAGTEQAVTNGWTEVRWPVAGLYGSPCQGVPVKDFHDGHRVYVWQRSLAVPECGSKWWVLITEPYGNGGWMREDAVW